MAAHRSSNPGTPRTPYGVMMITKGSQEKLFPHCARNVKPSLQSSLVMHGSPTCDIAQPVVPLVTQSPLQHRVGSVIAQILPLGMQLGAGVQVPLPVHLPVPLQAVPAGALTQVVPWSA